MSLRSVLLSEVLILARFFLPLTEARSCLEDGFVFDVRLSTSVPGPGIKGSPSVLPASWVDEIGTFSLLLEYSELGLLHAGDWALDHPLLPFSTRSIL